MTTPNPQIANPYASPATMEWTFDSDMMLSNPIASQQQRRFNDETSLKQNTLCLTGLFSLIAVTVDLNAFTAASPQPDHVLTTMAIMSTLVAAASIVVNFGVRRFASWSRTPLTILALMALPLVPIGSVFGLLIIKTLHLRNPPKLLTREYEQIVRATPELSDRTSFLTWFAVLLLITLAISMVFLAQIPELRHPR